VICKLYFLGGVYELWKGIGHAPEKTDVILKWSPKKPMPLIKAIIDDL
jgi:hypothetical protein